MRRNLNLIFGGLLFVLLQMLVAPRISIGEIGPDFMLLLVVYISLQKKTEYATIAGFSIGFFQDLFNPELLGLNALTKAIVGYGVSAISTKTEPDSAPVLFAIITAVAVINDFVYLLFFTGLDLGRFFILLGTVSVPSALYTALMGVAVYKAAEAFGSKAVGSFGKARP